MVLTTKYFTLVDSKSDVESSSADEDLRTTQPQTLLGKQKKTASEEGASKAKKTKLLDE